MIVTIDGKRGTGKSRLAASLREEFQCQVVDAGPLFRFLAHLEQIGVATSPLDAVQVMHRELGSGNLRIDTSTGGRLSATGIEYQGTSVLDYLWTTSIDRRLREIAENASVIVGLREIVNGLTQFGDFIVVGRDTGRQFCPSADLKIYLTADDDVRVSRKVQQLHSGFPGSEDPSLDIEVSEPRLDPGGGVESACLVLDTTTLSPEQVTSKVKEVVVRDLGWRLRSAEAVSASAPGQLDRVQERIATWQAQNFPACQRWELALGIAEEAGEIADCVLKMERGIRSDEYPQDRLRDAIGDLLIYASGLCSSFDWRLMDVLEDTANSVVKRRWKEGSDES